VAVAGILGQPGWARETASPALLLASNRVPVKRAEQLSAVQTPWASVGLACNLTELARISCLNRSHRKAVLVWLRGRSLSLDSGSSIDLFHQSHSDWTQHEDAQRVTFKSNATKVGHQHTLYSSTAAAKSIPSPMRCLISLSQAPGLVP